MGAIPAVHDDKGVPVRTTRMRALALTSGVTGIALILSACGSGGTQSEGAAGGGDEKITLSIATFNEFGYEDLITEYEDAHPDITIEHKKAAISQESRDNLNTRLAAGSGLSDIEAVETDWWPELMQFSDEFTDLKHEDVEGRWLDWKAAEATTEDGKLIGYGTDIGPEAICYRSDLFAAAGLPTDRAEVATLLEGDWDTYFEVGREFAATSEVPWFDSAGVVYSAMINQLEEPYETEDGEVKDLADNETAKELYEQVLSASVDDDLSAHLNQWTDDWTNAFQNDGFATMLCPGWMLGVVEGNAAGVEGWDVADVFPGGGGNLGGSYLTVPAQSEHPEEARELAAWLTAPEQQLKAFEAKGTFPSQVEALESEELQGATNAFFNGAPTGDILVNRAEAISVQPFKGPNYFVVHTAMTDAITRVDVEQTDDPQSSWQKAVEAYQALGLG